MKLLKSFFLFIFGVITLNTASASLGDNTHLHVQNKIPAGVWKKTCSEGLSKIQYISEDGLSSEMTEKFHQDRNCDQLSFEFITRGKLDYPSMTNTTNWLDFTYTEIQLVLYRIEIVNDFNERQVCSLNNWEIGKPQTITGLQCALFNITKPTQIPQAGVTKYGIFKIENDMLFYGQLTLENDSSTPDKRPKHYEPHGYKKETIY